LVFEFIASIHTLVQIKRSLFGIETLVLQNIDIQIRLVDNQMQILYFLFIIQQIRMYPDILVAFRSADILQSFLIDIFLRIDSI